MKGRGGGWREWNGEEEEEEEEAAKYGEIRREEDTKGDGEIR